MLVSNDKCTWNSKTCINIAVQFIGNFPRLVNLVLPALSIFQVCLIAQFSFPSNCQKKRNARRKNLNNIFIHIIHQKQETSPGLISERLMSWTEIDKPGGGAAGSSPSLCWRTSFPFIMHRSEFPFSETSVFLTLPWNTLLIKSISPWQIRCLELEIVDFIISFLSNGFEKWW